jgi:hypothetical protein
MDIENQVRHVIRMKGRSILPPEELRETVLRKLRSEGNCGLLKRYSQLRRLAQIAIISSMLIIFSGIAYAATSYFQFMELKNSDGKVQHRLFVGEQNDFERVKPYPGGWRWYDPKTKDGEKIFVNYEDVEWDSSMEELRRVFPDFKVPINGKLDRIQISYGYHDLSESEMSDLKEEAMKKGTVTERDLVKSTDIDEIKLYYTQGTTKLILNVHNFNNDGAISKLRNNYGYTQQLFFFQNRASVQERSAIQKYDASYVRNGNSQSVVWEEEEHKLQYTVRSESQELTKQELIDFANGLQYPSEKKETTKQ